MPKSTTGASKPLYEGKACYGELMTEGADEALKKVDNKLLLEPLITAYKWYPDKMKFFNNFFVKLAGTRLLAEMVENGMSAAEIRATWQEDIAAFKQVRKRYLLYPDFE